MSVPSKIGTALICLMGFAPTASHAGTEQTREAVLALLEASRETYGFPGATISVAASDGAVENFAVGVANTESQQQMTPTHRMLAASVGKTFWGALILSLEDDGVLKRRDLVSRHLGSKPWFDRVPNSATITIDHLLTHSAGVPDHVHMTDAGQKLIAMGDTGSFDPVDLVALVFDEPALFPAGEGWTYSDTGYVLLGLAIEAATGHSPFELVQKRFLEPLQLTNTLPSRSRTIPGLAAGYTIGENPFG